MANPDFEVDLTADEQPAPKLPDTLTGFFKKFNPNDLNQVAEKEQRERNEAERDRKRREQEERRKAERLLRAADERKKADATRAAEGRKRKKDQLEAARALLQDNTVQLECCSHYRSRLWLTARKPHEVTAALMLRYVCDKALILLIHAPSCQAWTDATPKALFSTSSRQRRSDRTPFFYSLAARGSGSRRTGFFFFHVVTASSELDFHEPLQFIRYRKHDRNL